MISNIEKCHSIPVLCSCKLTFYCYFSMQIIEPGHVTKWLISIKYANCFVLEIQNKRL